MSMLFWKPRWRAVAVCAGLAIATSAVARPDFPETEANDNKGLANPVTLACGDSVSGVTTGASTTTAGNGSADYFLITTPTTTPGIYKYTLTLTSSTPGHSATLRGLGQSTGVPTTADTEIQATRTVGVDRVNEFYGFGTGGQIYYRVTGGAATTSSYTSTLTCTPVTPIIIPGSLPPGSITIKPDAATDTAADTDFWLYDSNFNAIVDAGHDDGDATGLTRSLSAGTYYLAFGNSNPANHRGSPTDDTFRSGPVTDFAGVLVNSSTSSIATMNVTLSDGISTLTGFGSRPNAYEVVWYQFSVAVPNFPTAVGSSSPNPVVQGNPATLTVTITPAPGSSLDNITSVTGNVSAISGNGADTNVAFTRVGLSADWTYSITAANGALGLRAATVTIVDPQSPGGNGTANVSITIAPPPPPNDACSGATVINTIPFLGTDPAANQAFNDLDVSCNSGTNTEARFGVWYTYTTGADAGNLVVSETVSANDVTIAAFSGDCNNLTQIACTDAETNVNILLPQPNTQYWILVSMWSPTTAPTAAGYALNFSAFNAQTGACCDTSGCSIITASTCTGTFLGAGTTCAPSPQYDNAALGLAIPDYAGAVVPVTSTITVPATDPTIVTSLQVVVGITHAWGGDVKVTLTSPNSTTIDLFVRPGTVGCVPGEIGNGNDLNGTYVISDTGATNINAALIAGPSPLASGTYRPSTCGGSDTNLNTTFGGQPLAGMWTLTVSDEDEAITGTLNRFALIVNGGYSPCPGSCCVGTTCSVVSQATCVSSGGTFTAGGACTPTTCGGATTGACCRGSTCQIDSLASCTGFASAYAGNGTVCNVFGANNLAPCCLADYNHVGGITVQDIFDFLSGYFGADPKADINGGGTSVQDIFDYLSTYFSGGC